MRANPHPLEKGAPGGKCLPGAQEPSRAVPRVTQLRESLLASVIAAPTPLLALTALTWDFCRGLSSRMWPMYRPCSFRAARRRGESFGRARWPARARVAAPCNNSCRGRSSRRSASEIANADLRIAWRCRPTALRWVVNRVSPFGSGIGASYHRAAAGLRAESVDPASRLARGRHPDKPRRRRGRCAMRRAAPPDAEDEWCSLATRRRKRKRAAGALFLPPAPLSFATSLSAAAFDRPTSLSGQGPAPRRSARRGSGRAAGAAAPGRRSRHRWRESVVPPALEPRAAQHRRRRSRL